jgi:ribosome-binding protein aMBF1 (putative translation factor)
MKKARSNSARLSSSRKRRTTSDALEVIDRTLIGNDHEMRREVDQATVNALVAQLIYQTRTKAGLTQAQLARMAGTKQPVISQLEDADYAGHSLALLRRIAEALGKQLEIRFVDARRRKSA